MVSDKPFPSSLGVRGHWHRHGKCRRHGGRRLRPDARSWGVRHRAGCVRPSMPWWLAVQRHSNLPHWRWRGRAVLMHTTLTWPARACRSCRWSKQLGCRYKWCCPWSHTASTNVSVSCRTRQVEMTTWEPRATKSRWLRFYFSEVSERQSLQRALPSSWLMCFVHWSRTGSWASALHTSLVSCARWAPVRSSSVQRFWVKLLLFCFYLASLATGDAFEWTTINRLSWMKHTEPFFRILLDKVRCLVHLWRRDFRCLASYFARISLAAHVAGHGGHLHKPALNGSVIVEGDWAVLLGIMQIVTSAVRVDVTSPRSSWVHAWFCTFMNFSCHCELTDTLMAVKAQCDEERGAGKHICAAGGTDGEQAFNAVNASTCTWPDGTSCSRRPRPGEAWWPQ